MRRFLFWVMLLLVVAAVVLVAARYDQGYVLIVYPPWRVEMSFVLALALTIGVFLLGYIVMRFVQIVLRLPGDVRAWRTRRQRERGELQLARVAGALLAGQPEHARKLADKLMDSQPSALLALLAARAAVELGDAATAKRFLEQSASSEGELIAARQKLESQLADLSNRTDSERTRTPAS
jgi:HemY protein